MTADTTGSGQAATANAETKAAAEATRTDQIVAAMAADLPAIERAIAEDMHCPLSDAPAEPDPEPLPEAEPRAELRAEAAGFVNTEPLMAGAEDDTITGSDLDVNPDARAIGIDNQDVIALADGMDLVAGAGTAIGVQSAEAFGILNEGALRTGRDGDLVMGIASATGAFDGRVEGSALAFGLSEIDNRAEEAGVSSLRLGSGDDELSGIATARGSEDVGAFGLLLTDARTGGGADTVFGSGEAEGAGSTDARGVSVGLSDIDDDTLPPAIPAEVGILQTGRGRDLVQGTADVTVTTGAEDGLFFAGANGIVVDGGVDAEWRAILEDNLDLLAAAVDAGPAALDAALQALLAQLDTSVLDTGNGRDTLVAEVSLDVSEAEPGAFIDDDLEVIADGIENAGTVLLGNGNDTVVSEVSVVSTISGAKGLADAADNSSVGVITGLGLTATNVLRETGLIAPDAEVEIAVSDVTLFDLGAGDDSFSSTIFATAVDDLSAADGLGNRGVFVAGDGSDMFDLNARSVFVLTTANGDEQQEGIADGWENRNQVFLDDREGDIAGDGDDRVTVNAEATGDGVLTISDGLESRGLFDAGGGDDLFRLNASAKSGPGVLAGNITAATGLATEQIEEGDFLTRDGSDRIFGTANAQSEGTNRATIAQGISQITADTRATTADAAEDGLFSTTDDVVTVDNDELEGRASAEGQGDVQAFGLLFTNAETGRGADAMTGRASATGLNAAKANGIAIGISNNTDTEGVSLRPDETGRLSTGGGHDTLTAFAEAETLTDGAAIVSDANADSNGVLVDLGSSLDLGGGNNLIDASAVASDTGTGGEGSIAVTADGIEIRGTLVSRGGDDRIVGTAEATSTGGILLTIAGGIDNGFGSTRNAIPSEPLIETGAGDDALEGEGSVIATGGIGLASGIETSGVILTGDGDDRLSGTASAEVTDGIRAVADGIENAQLVDGGTGGLIETGAGDDVLVADVRADGINADAEAIAIRNDFVERGVLIARGRIDLGDGDDSIRAQAEASSTTGEAVAIGIQGGFVDTGTGNDSITAGSNDLILGENGIELSGGRGLGGDVVIDLGAGDDMLSAFGQGSASGGAGTDLLSFAFSLEDFQIGGGEVVIGDPVGNEVSFRFGGETLTTDGFEAFQFTDERFALGFDEILLLA